MTDLPTITPAPQPPREQSYRRWVEDPTEEGNQTLTLYERHGFVADREAYEWLRPPPWNGRANTYQACRLSVSGDKLRGTA